MPLQLAVITDIHHGPNTRTKCGQAALELTREFVADVNARQPDAVIELGDRISDVDPGTDRRLAREVAEVLADIRCPRFHVNGNHDLEHLSVAENAELLGQPMAHEVVSLGDWDLVLWRADPRLHPGGTRRLILPDADLEWLERTLSRAKRPQLVVSHIPVSPNAPSGNYYFERAPHLSAYPEAPRVRDVLSRAAVPVVHLTGHVHWNAFTQLGGIFYLAQQSLTESFTTDGQPAGAWGRLELGDTVRWQVVGKDPLSVGFTPRAGRWMAPLQPESRPLTRQAVS
ncbi:MAG: metallophosphoesterase family protein [Pseudomonadota bacterium]